MSDSTKVFALFPGQGSQKIGMGKELYENNSIARDIFERANSALGFSLSSICFEGPAENLTATEVAQPAILTVSYICYEIFKSVTNNKIIPIAAAGHSLGEYSALLASGALSFEDAVKQVNKRGKYMQEAVPVGLGAMLVILGKEVAEIEGSLSQVKSGVAQIANINAPGQVVVAGHKEAMEELKKIMSGAKIMDLPVSAPFHCSLMKPAEDRLRADLKTLNINNSDFPVIANYTANPESQAEEIRANLGDQVCGKVRWVESMQNAIQTFKPTHAVEFGYGNVLNGLLKRITPELSRLNVDSEENANKCKSSLQQ